MDEFERTYLEKSYKRQRCHGEDYVKCENRDVTAVDSEIFELLNSFGGMSKLSGRVSIAGRAGIVSLIRKLEPRRVNAFLCAIAWR